ncbi:hypothetical protein HVA01_27820 [Halovibrio variabilis]|uniref:Uncharacterized protein n=1 Tax=Halovibrio variabilis TaxID=31910 RepID=A0A511URC3_9GAMM|nr:hypothetical protein HVA01_27820 [Halovibrio variabilis]
MALIQEIYNVFYQQEVTGQARHRHKVIGSEAGTDGVELLVRDLESSHTESTRYDALRHHFSHHPSPIDV